jgi:hypothetical protein
MVSVRPELGGPTKRGASVNGQPRGEGAGSLRWWDKITCARRACRIVSAAPVVPSATFQQ